MTYKDKGSYESSPPCTLSPRTSAASPRNQSHSAGMNRIDGQWGQFGNDVTIANTLGGNTGRETGDEIPYLYRSCSAKVTYIWWLFCGK